MNYIKKTIIYQIKQEIFDYVYQNGWIQPCEINAKEMTMQ